MLSANRGQLFGAHKEYERGLIKVDELASKIHDLAIEVSTLEEKKAVCLGVIDLFDSRKSTLELKVSNLEKELEGKSNELLVVNESMAKSKKTLSQTQSNFDELRNEKEQMSLTVSSLKQVHTDTSRSYQEIVGNKEVALKDYAELLIHLEEAKKEKTLVDSSTLAQLNLIKDESKKLKLEQEKFEEDKLGLLTFKSKLDKYASRLSKHFDEIGVPFNPNG